jgi:hypothetical protein
MHLHQSPERGSSGGGRARRFASARLCPIPFSLRPPPSTSQIRDNLQGAGSSGGPQGRSGGGGPQTVRSSEGGPRGAGGLLA